LIWLATLSTSSALVIKKFPPTGKHFNCLFNKEFSEVYHSVELSQAQYFNGFTRF